MRILAPIEYLGPVGGAQRSVLEVAEALTPRGHEFVVGYRVADSFVPRWEALGATLIQLQIWTNWRHAFRGVAGIYGAVAELRDTHPDVIYCNFFATLPLVLRISRALDVPIAMSVREPTVSGVRRVAYTRMLNQVDAIAFNAIGQQRTYLETGMTKRDGKVIHIGLDTTRYHPAEPFEREQARKALGVDPDQILVLYLGRIDPTKGIETLFEASDLIGDPRITILVAGGPSVWRHDAQRYVDRLISGAPANVRFLGRLDDPLSLLAAADVLAMPSIWEEPLGRVTLEAMACGVPVVASRVGGTPDVFTGDLAELLFRAGDAGDLARALRVAVPALGGSDRWRQLVRQHIVEDFNITRSAVEIEALLTEATGRKAGTPAGMDGSVA